MIYTDKNYKNYEMISKHFRCSIWGEIHVSPVALQIIDSWEFQRLHYIRQTGFSYKVFPSSCFLGIIVVRQFSSNVSNKCENAPCPRSCTNPTIQINSKSRESYNSKNESNDNCEKSCRLNFDNNR